MLCGFGSESLTMLLFAIAKRFSIKSMRPIFSIQKMSELGGLHHLCGPKTLSELMT